MDRAVRANYGKLASEKDALELIVARLVSALDPQAIWLFGSRARGDARPDSDFDLLILAGDGGRFDCDDYDLVDAPLRETGIAADVVPCDMESFKANMGLATSFVHRIVHEGKLLYGGIST